MNYFVIEVEIRDGVWKPVGKVYTNKEVAKSWVSFVKKAWHARRARVAEYTRERIEKLNAGLAEARK